MHWLRSKPQRNIGSANTFEQKIVCKGIIDLCPYIHDATQRVLQQKTMLTIEDVCMRLREKALSPIPQLILELFPVKAVGDANDGDSALHSLGTGLWLLRRMKVLQMEISKV